MQIFMHPGDQENNDARVVLSPGAFLPDLSFFAACPSSPGAGGSHFTVCSWWRNLYAPYDCLGSLMGDAHPHVDGSARHHFALDSLAGRDHLDRIALLLQSGQRPVHEAGRRRHEAEGVSVHDPADAAMVPLERSGNGYRRLLVLGADLRGG